MNYSAKPLVISFNSPARAVAGLGLLVYFKKRKRLFSFLFLSVGYVRYVSS
jgi:hypothetical protein